MNGTSKLFTAFGWGNTLLARKSPTRRRRSTRSWTASSPDGPHVRRSAEPTLHADVPRRGDAALSPGLPHRPRGEGDYALDGFVVPKGTIVFTSPYVMQRTARFFPEPERYLPERWTPEETAKRPRFSYFPFGGGPRVCIGEPFAWMEMTLILAGLAQRWAADLPPGVLPKTQPRVTLRPFDGMPMTLRRR